jgi:hypothetical protein
MKRYFTLATLLMLGACSSGAPQPIDPPLSAAQAAKALNDAFEDRSRQANDPFGKTHSAPAAVSVETISDCNGDSGRALCKVAYSSSTASDEHAVLFWKTANPRHPWRAALVERSQP